MRDLKQRKLNETYWLDRLSGSLAKISLPLLVDEERYDGTNKELLQLEIPAALSDQLFEISSHSDMALFVLLFTGLNIVLHKYTGLEDLLIGTITPKTENVKDNILLCRNRILADQTFKETLDRVKQHVLRDFDHGDYSFGVIYQGLSQDKPEVFNVSFIYDKLQVKSRLLDQFDVNIVLSGQQERLVLQVEYHANIYHKEIIRRFCRSLVYIFDNLKDKVNRKIKHIDILNPEEIEELAAFNRTAAPYPRDKTLHALFEEQAARTPDRTAVAAKGTAALLSQHSRNFDPRTRASFITYRELNERANRLAGVLRKKGVGRGTIAAIMIDPVIEMVIGILGILKAGAAYLPIEPGMPDERIRSMLEDAGAVLLLTGRDMLENSSFTFLQGLNQVRSEPVFTPKRRQILDLDRLPIPDRSWVDYETYSRHIGQVMVKNVISLQTARGCPYSCFYCSKIWHDKHVSRSAENIFDELLVYYHMGVRRFGIFDDIFNINVKNSSKFFELIIKHGLDVQLFFANGLRGDLLTKEYIDLMVEAGLTTTALALETASPRLQKLINKNLKLDKFRENVDYFCEKYPRIILELFSITGFPTETEEEARLTLDFIKNCRWLHFPYAFNLKIYPDTEMAKLAMANGIFIEDILRSEDLGLHELSPTSPFKDSFTREYQAEFLNDYFFSKERLLFVLPYQLKVLTKDEMVQKYNSYLPFEINTFADLLKALDIREDELAVDGYLDEDAFRVPDLNRKIREYFPVLKPAKNALKVLFLDLSQYFSTAADMLYDVVEPPLGAMYVMTYLKEQLGDRVDGKILKSRVDFDSYRELKELLVDFKPDVIAARSLTFYKDFFHTTITLIRQWGFDVPIIAGGPYATRNSATLLQDRNIDLLVLSEGEETFREVIEKIIANSGKLPAEKVLREITGIAFVCEGRSAGDMYYRRGFAREILLLDECAGEGDTHSLQNLDHINHSSDPAYVIYTSGSTGLPKGVLVEHRSVVSVLHSFSQRYHLSPETHVIQLTNYTFDPSVEQIFTTLFNGAVLCLADRELIGDREAFGDFVDRSLVNLINFVPDALRELLGSGRKLQSLQVVISGGDNLRDSAKDLIMEKGYVLHNQYGPTETTIDALATRCTAGKVNLGKPIANVCCLVLDKYNKPVPIGVGGELNIGGAGVARGYLNNPELTADRFVEFASGGQLFEKSRPKTFNNKSFCGGSRGAVFSKSAPLVAEGKRLYRTGDLVRWLADGNIEFLGRIDYQVKLRGYRIELGEIENILSRHKAIKQAVALIREGEQDSKFICAYYTYDSAKEPELMPSVGDYCIWDDLLYYAMAHDKLKNNSYKIAIERFVKDKTVVEIGTGRDLILARMAVAAGARKVYAIEILEEYYLKAKENLKKYGLQDKIVLIHGDSRDVELPEKVDVNVTNQIGSIGSSEGGIVLHNDARRFLKEKNTVIPHQCITKIAAATLTDKLRENAVFTETSKEYTENIFEKFGCLFDVRLCVQHLPRSNVISDAGIFEDINFQEVIPDEAIHRINLTINKKAKLDGFILWLNFYTVPDHLVDTLEHEHVWRPVYMPAFSPALDVDEGDVIEADCSRTLSDNNLSPDYKVKGVVKKKNGRQITFLYEMPYFEKSYKAAPLYGQLFTNEPVNRVGDISAAPVDHELRQFLARSLPDYMIPAYFVPLKEFPVTSTGKIDRHALSDPAMMDGENAVEYAAPESDIEKKLVEVWESVLGRKQIGVNENFFMIGGDSIKAIQIVSRMNDEGYKIKMSDVFRNPLIVNLSPKVEKREEGKLPDQSIITGPVPLSPAQREFFIKFGEDSSYYNQAVMLYSREGFAEEALRAVFKKILNHHDALRMSFVRQDGDIIQTNQGITNPPWLQVYDFRRMEDTKKAAAEISARANEIQASIDLEKGPLMKLALFHLNDGDRLLIVCHHLVIDGISWRILFEDIGSLYQSYNRGDELLLPFKTDSFKLWSQRISAYADTPAFLEEKTYWKEVESKEVPNIEKDFAGSNYVKDAAVLSFSLSEEETDLLLTKVNTAFGTEINDILLTGLAAAVARIYGHNRLLVALEGHGREDIFAGIDISRTIGWFTSVYPVVLELPGTEDISRQVIEVKEILHKVPYRGIGYGILKYITAEENKQDMAFKCDPQISFNYLGQIDADVGKMPFRVAKESTGSSIGRDMQREYELDVSGMISSGRLVLSILYGRKQYKTENIESLIANYKTMLSRIISHCSSLDEKQLTPSDLDYKDLSVEELDTIFN